MPHFIGEEVEVKCDERPGAPSAFVWRGAEYRVAKILGHRLALDRNRTWYKRRHRDYYTVETEGGEVYKLYFHRGPGRRYWFLRMRMEE